MKKFTNIEESKELKKINPKINKLVEKLVSLNLSVSYSGDSDDIINKDIKISGVGALVEKLNLVVEKNVLSGTEKLSEQLKYSSISNDQEGLNKQIDMLRESKHDSIIYSPEDIFDSNDYKKSNKLFVLESMNSIPMDYLGKVNTVEATDYFSSGNKVSIIYEGLDKGWNVSFNSSPDYGTLTDDEATKYNYFVRENAEFIADFVSATTDLIGSKNLGLDNKLINNYES